MDRIFELGSKLPRDFGHCSSYRHRFARGGDVEDRDQTRIPRILVVRETEAEERDDAPSVNVPARHDWQAHGRKVTVVHQNGVDFGDGACYDLVNQNHAS